MKGELENALAQVPFEGLVVARPSLLVGNREAVGQLTRRGEAWGSALGKVLGCLIPANYKPIEAAAVARAMLFAVPSGKGKRVLLSGAMRREAFRPQ